MKPGPKRGRFLPGKLPVFVSDDEHEYAWLLHPDAGMSIEISGGSFNVRGRQAAMTGRLLEPADDVIRRCEREVADSVGDVGKRLSELSMSVCGRSVEFMVGTYFGAGPADEVFEACQLEGMDAERVIVPPGGRRVALSAGTPAARIC